MIGPSWLQQQVVQIDAKEGVLESRKVMVGNFHFWFHIVSQVRDGSTCHTTAGDPFEELVVKRCRRLRHEVPVDKYLIV